MKKIKINNIMETSYEDNTSWIEYEVDGKLGYEIVGDVTVFGGSITKFLF